jgi:hypothetical protein
MKVFEVPSPMVLLGRSIRGGVVSLAGRRVPQSPAAGYGAHRCSTDSRCDHAPRGPIG